MRVQQSTNNQSRPNFGFNPIKVRNDFSEMVVKQGEKVQQEVMDAFVSVAKKNADDPREVFIMGDRPNKGFAWIEDESSRRGVRFELNGESIEKAFTDEAQKRRDVFAFSAKVQELNKKYGTDLGLSNMNKLDEFGDRIPEVHELFENVVQAAAELKDKKLSMGLTYLPTNSYLSLNLAKPLGNNKGWGEVQYWFPADKFPSKDTIKDVVKSRHIELNAQIKRTKQAKIDEAAKQARLSQEQEVRNQFTEKVNNFTTRLETTLNRLA